MAINQVADLQIGGRIETVQGSIDVNFDEVRSGRKSGSLAGIAMSKMLCFVGQLKALIPVDLISFKIIAYESSYMAVAFVDEKIGCLTSCIDSSRRTLDIETVRLIDSLQTNSAFASHAEVYSKKQVSCQRLIEIVGLDTLSTNCHPLRLITHGCAHRSKLFAIATTLAKAFKDILRVTDRERGLIDFNSIGNKVELIVDVVKS